MAALNSEEEDEKEGGKWFRNSCGVSRGPEPPTLEEYISKKEQTLPKQKKTQKTTTLPELKSKDATESLTLPTGVSHNSSLVAHT